MKILYIATSFPHPKKGSTIYTDLAEELVSCGHEVVVVVSQERKYGKHTQWSNERGMRVLRVKTGNIYDVSFIEKGGSMITLQYYITKAINQYLDKFKFDLILYESPPVTNAGIVEYAKKKFNSKTYLMLKDIFPQNAVDINLIKKNSLIYKYFKNKEKQLYNISDRIGCMSEGNKKYILTHNSFICNDKVEVFPNTKKVKYDFQEIDVRRIREKYNIPLDTVVFLFGGNMGKPQGIDFLCEAIKQLREEKNIFFLLIGRGTERETIKSFFKNNNCHNALLVDNLPRDEYEVVTRACDVGLVLLDSKFTIPNYPSRILSYMEYSMPVLAATDTNTDFRDLIVESKCGKWVSSDNLLGFCSEIKELSSDESLRNNLGANGRQYLELYFDVKKSVEIIEKIVEMN